MQRILIWCVSGLDHVKLLLYSQIKAAKSCNFIFLLPERSYIKNLKTIPVVSLQLAKCNQIKSVKTNIQIQGHSKILQFYSCRTSADPVKSSPKQAAALIRNKPCDKSPGEQSPAGPVRRKHEGEIYMKWYAIRYTIPIRLSEPRSLAENRSGFWFPLTAFGTSAITVGGLP
jgi:hypothetical protein